MKITNDALGRWCSVKYEDVGVLDGVIVEIQPELKECLIYFIATEKTDWVEYAQITELRGHLKSDRF